MSGLLRSTVERIPSLYCAGARLRRGRNREVVSRRSDLLVESFPRSGTTFLVAGLEIVCPHLRVASHVHHVAHVRRAVDIGVPTVVAVRDPVAACVSLAIYQGVSVGASHLQRWIGLHEELFPLAQVGVIPFEELTSRPRAAFGAVLGILGETPVMPPGDLDERVNRRIDVLTLRRHGKIDPMRISRPTTGRTALKEVQTRRLLATEAKLTDQARELHARLVGRAVSMPDDGLNQ